MFGISEETFNDSLDKVNKLIQNVWNKHNEDNKVLVDNFIQIKKELAEFKEGHISGIGQKNDLLEKRIDRLNDQFSFLKEATTNLTNILQKIVISKGIIKEEEKIKVTPEEELEEAIKETREVISDDEISEDEEDVGYCINCGKYRKMKNIEVKKRGGKKMLFGQCVICDTPMTRKNEK